MEKAWKSTDKTSECMPPEISRLSALSDKLIRLAHVSQLDDFEQTFDA